MQSLKLDLDPGLNSGHPALEFTNTVSNHASKHPGERLFQYTDLLSWAKKIGWLSDVQVQGLTRRAANQPAEAATIFSKSLELREAIYRIFVAQTRGKPPAESDLAILNAALTRSAGSIQVVRRSGRFEWQWNFDENSLDSPLWMLALSALDLMTSENYQWVGQCADEDGCGWLFVDTSRNHSRRWCDINDCGNRAKQRRYQRRVQKR